MQGVLVPPHKQITAPSLHLHSNHVPNPRVQSIEGVPVHEVNRDGAAKTVARDCPGTNTRGDRPVAKWRRKCMIVLTLEGVYETGKEFTILTAGGGTTQHNTTQHNTKVVSFAYCEGLPLDLPAH